jgi:hypothetical protein
VFRLQGQPVGSIILGLPVRADNATPVRRTSGGTTSGGRTGGRRRAPERRNEADIGRTARAGAEGVAISLCDVEEAAFLRDIEKLIRMTIPVSDRRANQRWAKPPPAASAFIKSNVKAKGHRSGPARKQSRHGQSNEAPRGIDSVAFIHGKDRRDRDRVPRPQRRAGT